MPKMTTPKPIAEQLREAIAASGLSLREVARRADVSPPIVSKFMLGGNINLTSAEAISKALGKGLLHRT